MRPKALHVQLILQAAHALLHDVLVRVDTGGGEDRVLHIVREDGLIATILVLIFPHGLHVRGDSTSTFQGLSHREILLVELLMLWDQLPRLELPLGGEQLAVELADGVPHCLVVVVHMHGTALALLAPCVKTRDGVDHLSPGPPHVLGQLHVVALLAHQVPKPFAAHGDPYLELVSSGKEVIHVCCAVEAPVHDEMHLWHAKLGKGVQQVPQRPHVADIPRKLPVVHRKHALLAEEQGEVDL